jgi:hypothetical protein
MIYRIWKDKRINSERNSVWVPIQEHGTDIVTSVPHLSCLVGTPSKEEGAKIL